MELSTTPAVHLAPPTKTLWACVVVPARDEEELVGRCLQALADQVEVEVDAYEVIVVLDRCVDGTRNVVEAARGRMPGLQIHALTGPGLGSGPARALGMDLACARLESVGRPDGLIATTDADSEVAPDWLARQLDARARGAEAIGGEVILEGAGAASLPPEVLAQRRTRLRQRLAVAGDRGPADHPHFAGASLAITPRAYRQVGGLAPLPALEDRDLEDRLAASAIQIHRRGDVRVTTSARRQGRAERGLANDLAVAQWAATRSYGGSSYQVADLLAAKTGTIVVVLPAREVADSIGAILDAVLPLRDLGLLDRVIVVDADSADGTAAIAETHGAEVWSESRLVSEVGPCMGKGDAMWRAAASVEADTLLFLDTDTLDFTERFVLGLLGPILLEPEVRFVKGFFRRPFSHGERSLADEGGRVTELVARPLLNAYAPLLCGFIQPLAGELAIDARLFEQVSVPVGYGVEIAMLLDIVGLVGLDAMAQVDLGTRQNRHQTLRELGVMSAEVIAALEARVDPARGTPIDTFVPRPRPGEALESLPLRVSERPPVRRHQANGTRRA
jgi:glucosyl-3-phosphoglycerate synthase